MTHWKGKSGDNVTCPRDDVTCDRSSEVTRDVVPNKELVSPSDLETSQKAEDAGPVVEQSEDHSKEKPPVSQIKKVTFCSGF